MKNLLIEKIELRVTVRKIQLDGAKAALRAELVDFARKLDMAIKSLDKGLSNIHVSANMGYSVADIVRRQEEVEGITNEIGTLQNLIVEYEET